MMPELTLLGIAVPQWVVMAFALVVWAALLGIVFRMVLLRAHERLRCPVTGRMAYLTLLRGPDGALDEVVHCSLLRRGEPFACGMRCLRSAHA